MLQTPIKALCILKEQLKKEKISRAYIHRVIYYAPKTQMVVRTIGPKRDDSDGFMGLRFIFIWFNLIFLQSLPLIGKNGWQYKPIKIRVHDL